MSLGDTHIKLKIETTSLPDLCTTSHDVLLELANTLYGNLLYRIATPALNFDSSFPGI